jgi:hypothetical protein
VREPWGVMGPRAACGKKNLLNKHFQTSFITHLLIYAIHLVRNYLLLYLKTTWYEWVKNNKLEDTN